MLTWIETLGQARCVDRLARLAFDTRPRGCHGPRAAWPGRSEREGTKMAAEQGKGTGAGRVPALNFERIYRTTVPAEELAGALADHFRAHEFEAQVFRTGGDRTVMQARKESLWRHLLGVSYAITVVFTSGEGPAEHRPGGPRVGRRSGERGDRGGGGPAGAA